MSTKAGQSHPEKARDRIRDDFAKFQLPLTKAFHDRGGRLMAGSDALMIGVVPGFGPHRELVDAGLTPYEALRTSTTNPFEYLGERDRARTTAVRQHSELLLLSGDPLEDISAASRIEGVLIRGRCLGAQDLGDRMKALAFAYGRPAAENSAETANVPLERSAPRRLHSYLGSKTAFHFVPIPMLTTFVSTARPFTTARSRTIPSRT